jgi:hypothetical protein
MNNGSSALYARAAFIVLCKKISSDIRGSKAIIKTFLGLFLFLAMV